MAMDSAILAASIRTKMLAKATGAGDNSELTAFCEAIAEAVVDHITTSGKAVITVTDAGLQTSAAPGAPTGPPIIQALLGLQ